MRNRILLSLCTLLILYTLASPKAFAGNDAPNILILHSYSIDYAWTQDQHDAFIRTLNDLGIDPRYSVEVMDTKKYTDTIDYSLFRTLITQKHQNRSYDLIYATDNDALNFLALYKDELFPNCPVIASGINFGTPLEHLDDSFHIIIEKAEYMQTIAYLMENQPQVKDLYIINDQSTTGQIVKEQISAKVPAEYPSLELHWVEDQPVSAFSSLFSALGPNDGVLFTIYFTDSNNEIYYYNESVEAAVRYSTVPVWCIWSFSLNTGTIGGHLVSADQQGIEGARAAAELLNARPVPKVISDTIQMNRTVIDYEVMKRFNISDSIFPSNTVYLNKPISYFEQNRTLLISFTVVIAVMAVIILFLVKIIRDQRIIHNKNSELLAMKSAVITNQKEIVFRMGELIETRSHETGNHVRRVALVSRALGERIGLHPQMLQELETAAPMHDVGKIALSEAVLEKPGQLTEEERAVMKTHTSLGYEIFRSSSLPIFQTAAIIAHQHHEYWNGGGYPNGLSGEDIHILARIVALTDVFDALLSWRPYKEPWEMDRVTAFILEQKGQMFDPELVDHFIEIQPELIAIRDRYRDYQLNENMCPIS